MERIRPFQRWMLAAVFAVAAAGNALAEDARSLNALLDHAKPGDVIETASADFGETTLAGYAFNPAVTIKFSERSSIRRLTLRNVSGVTFDGLNVIAGVATRPVSENAVIVLGGGDIAFINAHFRWEADADPQNDGTALVFDGVDGITVSDSVFQFLLNGVIIRSSKNATIRNSDFTEILKDGIVVAGTDGVVIDNNICSDFASVEGVNPHPDCIQLQAGGRAVADKNAVIKNNKIIRGSGARIQGIFVSSRHENAPHVGVTIENNFVEQSMGLGIAAINTKDLIIRGNEVRRAAEDGETPRILVREPAENVTVENNIAAIGAAPAGVKIAGNKLPQNGL